jgi:hypothetical protein
MDGESSPTDFSDKFGQGILQTTLLSHAKQKALQWDGTLASGIAGAPAEWNMGLFSYA